MVILRRPRGVVYLVPSTLSLSGLVRLFIVVLKFRRSSFRICLRALTLARYSIRFWVGEMPRGLYCSSSRIDWASREVMVDDDLTNWAEPETVLYISFALRLFSNSAAGYTFFRCNEAKFDCVKSNYPPFLFAKLLNVSLAVISFSGFLCGLTTPKFLNCSSFQSRLVTVFALCLSSSIR